MVAKAVPFASEVCVLGCVADGLRLGAVVAGGVDMPFCTVSADGDAMVGCGECGEYVLVGPLYEQSAWPRR